MSSDPVLLLAAAAANMSGRCMVALARKRAFTGPQLERCVGDLREVASIFRELQNEAAAGVFDEAAQKVECLRPGLPDTNDEAL